MFSLCIHPGPSVVCLFYKTDDTTNPTSSTSIREYGQTDPSSMFIFTFTFTSISMASIIHPIHCSNTISPYQLTNPIANIYCLSWPNIPARPCACHYHSPLFCIPKDSWIRELMSSRIPVSVKHPSEMQDTRAEQSSINIVLLIYPSSDVYVIIGLLSIYQPHIN